MPTSNHLAPTIVIAPDSFKGSLTAQQVAAAIGRGILQAIPDAQLHYCPIADGGEGTLEVMLHAGGQVQTLTVRGAGGAHRQAPVALLPNGTAVIESAEIVGITDATGMNCAVTERSTEGIGDAIRQLLDQGIRSFLIALGGSSTNDGGSGLLRALGVKFFDVTGKELLPGATALRQLATVDMRGLDPRLAASTMIGMSDVDNPLCGPHGATAIFGPQKGVQPDQIAAVDAALAHYASLLESAACKQATTIPGAGAAGGLGYALLLLGAHLQSGAEAICEQIGLDRHLQDADWLITGEGRSDVQTLHGKAPFIAARRARGFGVDSTLLSGAIDQDALSALNAHFNGCFSIVLGPATLESAIAGADQLLQASAAQLAGLWQAGRHRGLR